MKTHTRMSERAAEYLVLAKTSLPVRALPTFGEIPYNLLLRNRKYRIRDTRETTKCQR